MNALKAGMVQKDKSFDGEKREQFLERKVYNKDEGYFPEGSARWSGDADVIVVWLSEFGVQTAATKLVSAYRGRPHSNRIATSRRILIPEY